MAIKRSVTGVALCVIIAFACTAAGANEVFSDAPTADVPAASASLGFRIVIREALRFDGQAERRHPAAAKTSRVITTLDDHPLVTIVRP